MTESPWSDYYKDTIDKEPNETLVFAANLIKEQKNKQALDIGSGTGSDTIHLLDLGFRVVSPTPTPRIVVTISSMSSECFEVQVSPQHTPITFFSNNLSLSI